MKWFDGPIPTAIAKAKEEKKVILVYIEGKDDMSQKMTETYNNPVVENKLENQVVSMKLQGDSEACQMFSQIYPVVVFPSSFFIGLSGMPLEVIAGSLEPAEFIAKVEKVLQIHQSSIMENEPPPSHSINGASSVAAPNETLQHEIQNGTGELSTEMHTFSNTQQQDPALLQHSARDIDVSSEDIQPATSSEKETLPTDTLTSTDDLEERVERAKQLIAKKNEQKLMEAEEKERLEELDRRRVMKDMQKARELQRDSELREWAQSRAKEKHEEQLVRERVKAQIAQDRLDRAARYQQVRNQQQEESRAKREALLKTEQQKSSVDAAIRSQYARIQFRLADGSSVTHQFSADDTLDDVRCFVTQNLNTGLAAFSLCTTFPRRHFTRGDYPMTLRDLELCPSAVLLILPEQAVESLSRGSASYSRFFWFMISPLVMLWGFVCSFFFGSRSSQSEGGGNAASSNRHSVNKNDTGEQSNTRRDEQRNTQRKPDDSQFYYQEGNIYRISNRRDDNDDNNTWNGNSTQQM